MKTYLFFHNSPHDYYKIIWFILVYLAINIRILLFFPLFHLLNLIRDWSWQIFFSSKGNPFGNPFPRDCEQPRFCSTLVMDPVTNYSRSVCWGMRGPSCTRRDKDARNLMNYEYRGDNCIGIIVHRMTRCLNLRAWISVGCRCLVFELSHVEKPIDRISSSDRGMPEE